MSGTEVAGTWPVGLGGAGGARWPRIAPTREGGACSGGGGAIVGEPPPAATASSVGSARPTAAARPGSHAGGSSRAARPTPSAAIRAPGTGTGDRDCHGGCRRRLTTTGRPYGTTAALLLRRLRPVLLRRSVRLLAVLLQRLLRLLAVLLRAARYRDSGSLRVIVDPEKTRVYVDGYYAGIADDFDGIFQRLYRAARPPRHQPQARRLPHAPLQGLRARRPDDQDPPRHGARHGRGHRPR